MQIWNPFENYPYPFLSPQPTILLVCARDWHLWLSPAPEVRDSQTHCQIWLIRQTWLAKKFKASTLRMLRNWERPEVSIPGADQKDRCLWERECTHTLLLQKREHTILAENFDQGIWKRGDTKSAYGISYKTYARACMHVASIWKRATYLKCYGELPSSDKWEQYHSKLNR